MSEERLPGLRCTRGRVPIAAPVDECGWSRRHLDRRFADGIGSEIPPSRAIAHAPAGFTMATPLTVRLAAAE
ncbi:hypothetical protein ABZ413_03965 [Nocardia rhamnosiphila]|uniref:hypothetical protein n=1 Tax=Nocardia rhamnosiphila TaxID=426716 RepID=UPI0033C3979F